MIRRVIKVAFGVSVAAVLAVGSLALVTPAPAVFRPCICPDVYAPVKCSNGVTYSNACRASCAHATGCVPTGNI